MAARKPNEAGGEPAKKTQATPSLAARAQHGDRAAADLFFDEARQKGNHDTVCRIIYDRYFDGIEDRTGKNMLLEHAVRETLRKKREALGYATAPPLEKLLIERIVLCEQDLKMTEARMHGKLNSEQGVTIEVGTYFQKSIDRAQKRYLAAIQSLAVVRRLAMPPTQINLARQQMNFAVTGLEQAALPSGNEG